jgi:hypothetical protein
MTRTERIATNPNYHVGHHPLINSDQLDPYFPEEEGRRPGASSAFNDATFHKGKIHWQPCPFSRKILERFYQEQCTQREIPGRAAGLSREARRSLQPDDQNLPREGWK